MSGSESDSDDDFRESDEGEAPEPQNNEIDESHIGDLENRRKILANKASFPVASNLEEWNQLRNYRNFQSNDKTLDLWTLWPMYAHPDAACLVSISDYVLCHPSKLSLKMVPLSSPTERVIPQCCPFLVICFVTIL